MPLSRQIDIHVGKRIRLARLNKRRSRIVTATLIGVSERTLQGYEDGRIPTPAQHLFGLGKSLDVTIAYFFDDYEPRA